MSSRFGTVNLPLWRPSNVPLSISGATREKGIIKSDTDGEVGEQLVSLGVYIGRDNGGRICYASLGEN